MVLEIVVCLLVPIIIRFRRVWLGLVLLFLVKVSSLVLLIAPAISAELVVVLPVLVACVPGIVRLASLTVTIIIFISFRGLCVPLICTRLQFKVVVVRIWQI